MEIGKGISIGIDATNVGGGGGITHLIEILTEYDEKRYQSEINKIIIYGRDQVLEQLPNSPMFEKVSLPALNKGVIRRILFQWFSFDKELSKSCDILLSITGDYTGSFQPVVGMSRNMLLYERDIWSEIGNLKEVLRFWSIYHKQKRCFNRAGGIIFISEYARNLISNKLDLQGKNKAIIHHGVADKFNGTGVKQKNISSYSEQHPFKFLYVSTVHVYKHQWNVVKAISELRNEGFPVSLALVGGVIFKPAGEKLKRTILNVDPNGEFIQNCGHVNYEEIEKKYKSSDAIIFASTCENMPNILIESMASGLAVACSNKQPMPEFLGESELYFDSYEVSSIKKTLHKLIRNEEIRKEQITRNLQRSSRFSWKRTSTQTFDFLVSNYKEFKKL